MMVVAALPNRESAAACSQLCRSVMSSLMEGKYKPFWVQWCTSSAARERIIKIVEWYESSSLLMETPLLSEGRTSACLALPPLLSWGLVLPATEMRSGEA